MHELIFKIAPKALWREAEAEGVFRGAPVDEKDGFIHFSTAEQVAETARKHFAGQEELLLIAVRTAPLGERLRWEPSRGGALFPHLYAPMPLSALAWVEELPLNEDGTHRMPAGLGRAARA
ncbi:DUF952 domain-containing protein [Afifella pfennigii]|uniref:DUF952 domain-containing protein n=1 Tax=Afifella pfennigii TaxID=209897 RepID=UPI00047ED3AF|nr:DUF952 domain-containing protein [Afifella pfennigii]